MTARLFDGQFTTASVSFAAGDATFDQGPITMGVLVKPAASAAGALCYLLVGRNTGAGADVFALVLFNGKVFLQNDFTAGVDLITTLDHWWWIVATKGAGSVPPRYHVRDITAGADWIHVDGAGNVPDNTGPVSTITVGNSSAAGSDDLRGKLAVAALWGGALTDGDIEAACTLAAYDLAAANPDWGTLWNQASTATPVADFSGGGGNQTALSATSVDSDTVEGFDYSLTAPPSWRADYDVRIG